MTTEDILERLLAGEVDLDAPEVSAAAAKNPALRAEIERMRAAAAHLRALGRQRREVIEEAATLRDVPGEEHVARIIGQRRHRLRSPLLLALAACVLVGAALAWKGWTSASTSSHDYLGPASMSPQGEVAEYGEFRWTHGGAGCAYVVTVFDVTGKQLGSSGRIREQRWTPTFELPPQIEWQLEVKTPDPDNDPAPYRARARRPR